MDKIKLHKYEKPTSLEAGKVASILGAVCSDGSVASDGCVIGDDPHVAPVCQPGDTATFNCGIGTVNTTGSCTSGGDANGECDTGSSALS